MDKIICENRKKNLNVKHCKKKKRNILNNKQMQKFMYLCSLGTEDEKNESDTKPQ